MSLSMTDVLFHSLSVVTHERLGIKGERTHVYELSLLKAMVRSKRTLRVCFLLCFVCLFFVCLFSCSLFVCLFLFCFVLFVCVFVLFVSLLFVVLFWFCFTCLLFLANKTNDRIWTFEQ